MNSVYSEFLGISIGLEKLSEVIAAGTDLRYVLTPLAIKCTYPVFRGEADGLPPVFVKIGTEEEWRRTLSVHDEIGSCGLLAPLCTRRRMDYKGYVVFVTEWRDVRTISPEDFTEEQKSGFLRGCGELTAALCRCESVPLTEDLPESPQRLWATVTGYASRHPFAGRLLKSLLSLSPSERSYEGRRVVVLHGDFHYRNFGFSGDALSTVFDFDKLSRGLACGDLVNALVDRFSRLGLSASVRKRLRRVAGELMAESGWAREELAVMINIWRLKFAARRLEKHPNSAWVALDVLRRDRGIRELLSCLR